MGSWVTLTTKARAQTFEALAQKHPDWDDVQVNLAIATLNRQQAGDEATALAIVSKVLARNPEHLRAHYVAGLLSLNAGESQAALQHFEKVAGADPQDAYAAYYVALCRAQIGESDAALESYQRAMSLDPYLRSAYYGAFQALQRLKKREEARVMLGQFQRLADNPQARLAEFKYTRMGTEARRRSWTWRRHRDCQTRRSPCLPTAQPCPGCLRWTDGACDRYDDG